MPNSQTLTLLGVNLIEELGLGPLSEKEKDKFLDEATDVISRRIMLKALETLSDEDSQKLTEMLKKDPSVAEQFLLDNIPNFSEIVSSEIANFKAELLATVSRDISS